MKKALIAILLLAFTVSAQSPAPYPDSEPAPSPPVVCYVECECIVNLKTGETVCTLYEVCE